MQSVKTGLIGCGNISSVYLKNTSMFTSFAIVQCADLDVERARERAEEFNIARYGTVADLLDNPEIELVINLTTPHVHAQISRAILEAGKHVYSEKPLAVLLQDGEDIVQMARERNLRVGVAPDTVLGAGIQTCRQLIDSGEIGTPVAATAFMMSHGHEHWHPDPAFYYQVGGGPMFDMGPYYLSALVTLLGPVRRVTGSTSIAFPERTITSSPKAGEVISVETPTHIAGVMDFHTGAIGTIVTSFDVWSEGLPCIEVYGTRGTLSVPDPNRFSGPVRILRPGSKVWDNIPITYGYNENSRGLGVADMAAAIQTGRPHRANAEMAYHVLELMHGFHIASDEGRHYELVSTCSRPLPMDEDGGVS
ncbi:Gfo/Idh/MocA family protein [Alicyclobacillus ferrooxydans]|uniref:Oxidoreductase n=1 Tax=Alicyclobacillus ferrooxydans TaxID=471514 RepID=A0A0P9CW18_9BACL|nr:Gfo/Idh/MocA family oxidoreductase [Alicyclobacillus ferrooxydans]KPV40852.1 oxidoreductase [Alicyclobacillus ferrooxydans]